MKEIRKAFLVNDTSDFAPYYYGVIIYQDGTREFFDKDAFLSKLNENFEILESQIPKMSRKKFTIDYSIYNYEYNEFVAGRNREKRKKARIVSERLGLDFSKMLENIYDYGKYKKKEDKENVERIDSFVNKCFNIASSECRRSGISYIEDESKAIEDVLSKLMIDKDNYPAKDVSFCTSSDAVYNKYAEDISKASNTGDFDRISRDYDHINRCYIINYLSSFQSSHGALDDFLLALVDDAYPNRDLILQSWTEFFLVCREFSCMNKAFDECIDDSYMAKANFHILMLESNKKFMSDLDLLLEHNPDEETYYYHATMFRKTAQNILDKGLYMYGEDLESTAYPELSRKNVLSFEYGNGLGSSATYVVVLREKEGTNIVRNTTDLEREESVGISRRAGMDFLKCNYIVDPENIVGFIDRKKGEVVFNKMVKKDINSKEGKNEK